MEWPGAPLVALLCSLVLLLQTRDHQRCREGRAKATDDRSDSSVESDREMVPIPRASRPGRYTGRAAGGGADGTRTTIASPAEDTFAR
jgi:hypothetical protein